MPVQVYEPGDDDSPVPPDDVAAEAPTPEEAAAAEIAANQARAIEHLGDEQSGGRRRKYVIGDVPVLVAAERVQYYDTGGKLVTESLRDYVRKAVREQYTSLEAFLKRWSEAERKQAIVKELEEHGVFFEELANDVGRDFSAFDPAACRRSHGRPT